ncbi:hypothetical protein [Paracoccus beibuensis]|uniref:hypothetical protein n=1 Tax=Paracoccus beibuensis TaxID=547602 RepID=UPI00389927DC
MDRLPTGRSRTAETGGGRWTTCRTFRAGRANHPSRAPITPEVLQALRLLLDRQREIQHVSSETYETVLPLTALLDLLRRPKDQEELGRQLAEALRQILVSTQKIAQDLATLISAQREQREEVRGLTAQIQEVMAAQRLLIDGQASLNRTVAALGDDLFEGERGS